MWSGFLNWKQIEDSPKSLTYQFNPLQDVGFKQIEILHKISCFAAFGVIK